MSSHSYLKVAINDVKQINFNLRFSSFLKSWNADQPPRCFSQPICLISSLIKSASGRLRQKAQTKIQKSRGSGIWQLKALWQLQAHTSTSWCIYQYSAVFHSSPHLYSVELLFTFKSPKISSLYLLHSHKLCHVLTKEISRQTQRDKIVQANS